MKPVIDYSHSNDIHAHQEIQRTVRRGEEAADYPAAEPMVRHCTPEPEPEGPALQPLEGIFCIEGGDNWGHHE